MSCHQNVLGYVMLPPTIALTMSSLIALNLDHTYLIHSAVMLLHAVWDEGELDVVAAVAVALSTVSNEGGSVGWCPSAAARVCEKFWAPPPT
jgi:uncharacterized protein (DUF1501 family)